MFKAGEGAGRSGSFFFFSHDNKFIIKTMTDGEFNMYLKRLPAFGEHYKANKNSLLAKILGVYTVNTKYIEDCHIMLMENTCQLKDKKELRYIFDLKGSMVDRKVKGKTTAGDTLKDENFLMCVDHHNTNNPHGGKFVNLNKFDKKKLLQGMRADVAFMRD